MSECKDECAKARRGNQRVLPLLGLKTQKKPGACAPRHSAYNVAPLRVSSNGIGAVPRSWSRAGKARAIRPWIPFLHC